MARVQVFGLNELEKRLDKLKDEGREAVATALNKQAKNVAADANRRAPRDDGELGKSNKQTVKATKFKLIAQVNSTAVHAPWVEFGTIKDTAQPFMRPAFDDALNEIDRKVEEALNAFL